MVHGGQLRPPWPRGSGDTRPYSVQREIEDLSAVIAAAGGSAMVFGGSSGAALALAAAARTRAITRLALWEPPYHVDPTAPPLPADLAARLAALAETGRRAEALELFLTRAAEVPAAVVAAMRADPSWPAMEGLAHTLAYEAEVMGPGNPLPARTAASLGVPVLVLNGGASPAWMRNAGTALARTIPGAAHRVLDGEAHNVSPNALAPELLEFFAQGRPEPL
ncbi:alpha/beta fold hydrolase [Thermocatellispora tengchongensis]|uniref:alpha/beta fold hydrolase n=1 Tax=Thermocatellispora tengchongensis TaxID=1073253 RepID=UPI00362FEEF8